MSLKIAHIIEEKERTDDICFKENTPFHKMLLKDGVKKGLDNCGFIYPTVIQANAIPIGKAGIDLLCQSKSGTGKTLIFSTILLEQYQELIREPQSLILVPTREIALQNEGVLNKIGEHLPGFRAVTVIGGLELTNDRKKLALAKAVVGTPGRVLHLIQNEMLNTSKIQLFIIDEADKMMSKTFLNDFQKINKSLPKKKQMIACSATFCDDLDKKIASYMKSPLLVSTDKGATLLIGIKQFIYDIPEQKTSILEMSSKLRILKKIFSKISFKQCLAFASSQSRAESYKNTMEKDGWPCEVITGAQDQKTRIEVFKKFKEFKTRILFSTDLMARGIDSEHVNLVLNIEAPDDGPTYLHRIGRAGRFGSHGIAITFISSQKELERFKTITESIGSGLNLFKYPMNDMLDIWNFTHLETDNILEMYNFNEPHLDKAENFLNDISSPVNSTSETGTATPTAQDDNNINSKTYKIEYLDHDSNANKILLTETMSSLQRLPSSNTIDDASSIAVDSDVLRSNSIGSRDLKTSNKISNKNKRPNNNSMSLLEVLIDNSKSSSTEHIDLFEDYKSFDAITANNSGGAGKSKTDETIINKINLKDLLVDQPKKTKKPTKDAFSEYEKLNNNENNGGLDLNDLSDSNSYSITTTSQQYDQSATDTSRLPLKEELNLKIPQIEGDSSSQSTQEKLQKPHFPSPNNCNDRGPNGGGGDADNELSNLQHINVAILEANNNDSDSTHTNDSIASNASSSSFEGISSSSSGFDEKTTSAKTSGISTSNDEEDDDEEDDSFDYNASFEDDETEEDEENEDDLYDEVEEEYENDDDDNDDEETYQTSDSEDVNDNPENDFIPPPTTFSDITNNETTNQTNDKNCFQSCSYHEYVNDIGPNISGKMKMKKNSRNNVTPIPSSPNQNHYYSTVADNNPNSSNQDQDQEEINLMYQNAYARWTDLYWNQMTQIQDYVRFCKYVSKNHL